MPVTPTGALSRALHLVREALAGMSAFRTWCGVATPEEARVRVVHAADETTQPTRPYVVLYLAPGAGGQKAVAAQTFVTSGTLRVAAFGATTSGYVNDDTNALLEMQNNWWALLACLRALSGTEVDGVLLQFNRVGVPAGGEAGFVEPTAHAGPGHKFELWEGQAELGWGGED